MTEEKELTDSQVRWRYEKIVNCWLEALKHFHALREHSRDMTDKGRSLLQDAKRGVEEN